MKDAIWTHRMGMAVYGAFLFLALNLLSPFGLVVLGPGPQGEANSPVVSFVLLCFWAPALGECLYGREEVYRHKILSGAVFALAINLLFFASYGAVLSLGVADVSETVSMLMRIGAYGFVITFPVMVALGWLGVVISQRLWRAGEEDRSR